MKPRLASTLVLSLALYIPIAQGQTSQPASDSIRATHCSVPSDDRAIRDISERWKAAYNNGQASQVSALYSDDAYYLTQHFVSGIIHDRFDIQAYVQRGIDAKYRIAAIEVLATHMFRQLRLRDHPLSINERRQKRHRPEPRGPSQD